jgi:hypothetical protein
MSDRQNELVTVTDGEAVNVEIAKLNREHTQLRVKMDPQAVDDYAEQYKNRKACTMPPVVVFKDEDGSLYLGDGFHRCAAKESLGVATIQAEIREGTIDDAILFAANCNRHNAVRWTGRDKRNAVKTLLEHFPKNPQRWIADQCGCSHVFVGKVQKELRGEGDDPEPKAKDKSSKSRKSNADKFDVATADAERLLDDLIRAGELDPEVPSIGAGLMRICNMTRTLMERFPGVRSEFTGDGNGYQSDDDGRASTDPIHKLDQVLPKGDGDVIDAVAIQHREVTEDDQSDDAGDYEDVDGDQPEPETPPKPKRKRGRPPARFKVTGSRGTWFVEDTEDDSADEQGPFDTKDEAEQVRRGLERDRGSAS